MARTLIVFVVVVFINMSTLHATVLVLLSSADRIVLAADSRSVAVTGEIDDTACKIWASGTRAIAASGDVITAQGHDVRKIAPEALRQQGSLLDKFTWAVRELQRQDNANPVATASRIALFFAAYNDNGPAIQIGLFRLRGVLPIVTRGCGGADCVVAIVSTVAASPTDVASAKARLTMKPSEREMIEMASAIASEHADLTPRSVGGPIDIVVLDSSGVHWVARKPHCPSVSPLEKQ